MVNRGGFDAEKIARDLIDQSRRSDDGSWGAEGSGVLVAFEALRDGIADALKAAHAAGRAEGVKEAAKIADRNKCQVIRMDEWAGMSCLDQMEHAAKNPKRYSPNFAKRLAAGLELCEDCSTRHAIRALVPR